MNKPHFHRDATTRRQSTLSYSSKLGTKIGRLRATLPIAANDADAPYYHYALIDARGAAVLAEELKLSPAILQETRNLESVIADFVEPPGSGQGEPAAPSLAQTTAGLMPKIIVELEQEYDDEHRIAFEISERIARSSVVFVGASGDEGLEKHLYGQKVHAALMVSLGSLVNFCTWQQEPPIPLSEVTFYTEGFEKKALSAQQLIELRERVLVHWPQAIENYFDPISDCDAQTIEERSGLSLGHLLDKTLRLGTYVGEFSSVLTGHIMDSTDPEFVKRAYRIDFLLRQLSIPSSIEPFREQIVAHIRNWKPDDREESFEAQRVAFHYKVYALTSELLSCFFSNLVSELFVAGYYLGQILPFLNIDFSELDPPSPPPAPDEPQEGPDDVRFYVRAQTARAVSDLAAQLHRLPVSNDTRGKMDRALQIWIGESSQDDLRQVRAFIKGELYGAIYKDVLRFAAKGNVVIPDELAHLSPSVENFLRDHPDYDKNFFVMMRFRETEQHAQILSVIQEALGRHGLKALRADFKDYSDDADLLKNVCVYMLGCKYGIAVFEEIEEREFNPNVALEVGFMIATGKRFLIVKDKRMEELPTDVMGKLYKPFNTYKIAETLPAVLEEWLSELGVARKP